MQELHKDSALEMRFKQLKKYMTLGLVGVLVLSLLGSLYVGTVKQSEQVAQTNQQTQAKLTIGSDVCKVYPDQELCVLARKIAANPGEAVIPKDGINGKDGAVGATGRGVSTFSKNDSGDLMVTFTDGQTENIGRVVGKDGINGKDGRGILSTSIDSGSLNVHYTDGTTQNLGIIVGPAGSNGQNGSPGATGAAGPQGPAGTDGANGTNGKDGISVVDLKVDPSGNVVVYYSNNTSSSAGKVIVNTITSMNCNKDTNVLTITIADGTAFSTTVDCTPETLPALTK